MIIAIQIIPMQMSQLDGSVPNAYYMVAGGVALSLNLKCSNIRVKRFYYNLAYGVFVEQSHA